MTEIYLISPPKIEPQDFLPKLTRILKTNHIRIFQLRLKEVLSGSYLLDDGIKPLLREIKKICCDNNCKFLLNDDYKTALDLGLDGVHVGHQDSDIELIRKFANHKFLIGASCYDSQDLAIKSEFAGASYVSFGSFFKSKTKNSIGRPKPEIIVWAKKNLRLPIVSIGGINEENCEILIKNQVEYLAIIGAVWDRVGKEVEVINQIMLKISKNLT